MASKRKKKQRMAAEKRRNNAENNASSTSPLSGGSTGSTLYHWLSDGLSSAGVAVNEHTAMCVSAVYACLGLIGGAIASMPVHIYQRTSDGRARVDHDLWWMLNQEPNANCTAATFWEYLSTSRGLHGDGFAKILRASPLSPRIVGFEALHPLNVEPFRDNGRIKYVLHRQSGVASEIIDADDMLHVPGLGFNGLRSMSPLRFALRSSVGIALAADEYSARFFGNGARPDYFLTTDGVLKQEQVDLIKDGIDELHRGVSQSHRPGILQGGLKVDQLTLSAEDAQLIATRQFQVADIARIYGVPAHMIGHTEKTTSWGSGVEQLSIGFVKYTLQRHLVNYEQEINRKCLRDRKLFSKFNTAGLERGDIKTRNEAHRIALGRAGEPGWTTINEVRKLEDMAPIEGGSSINTGATNESTAPIADR